MYSMAEMQPIPQNAVLLLAYFQISQSPDYI